MANRPLSSGGQPNLQSKTHHAQ